MPKYIVTQKEIEIFEIEVESADEDEAEMKAHEKLEKCWIKDEYHIFSDIEMTIVEY